MSKLTEAMRAMLGTAYHAHNQNAAALTSKHAELVKAMLGAAHHEHIQILAASRSKQTELMKTMLNTRTTYDEQTGNLVAPECTQIDPSRRMRSTTQHANNQAVAMSMGKPRTMPGTAHVKKNKTLILSLRTELLRTKWSTAHHEQK